MATADQVKALVRSHAHGDDAQFYSVAMQVAARAARNGQNRFAQELRELVDAAKAAQPPAGLSARPVPVARPRGELATLLTVSYPSLRLNDMSIPSDLQAQLKRVIAEQRQRERLIHRGFEPLRKLLLIGPPGTGKTMTAGVLAGELKLPQFLIRLESVLTKFMGETAAKLRLVFDAMEQTRGIYLFDEVDALAGDRSIANDVGEIRRILNSFLQFLEQDFSASIIVATTNHPQLLDRAMFRRFDSVLEFTLPTAVIAQQLMRRRLATFDTKAIDWHEAAQAANGLSHSEITLACDQAAKGSLLNGKNEIGTVPLAEALAERRSVAKL